MIINKLTENLTKTKSLNNNKFWLINFIVFLLGLCGLLLSFGIRHDYNEAINSGAMFIKPGFFIIVFIIFSFLSLDISRPNGEIKLLHKNLLRLSVLGFIAFNIYQLSVTNFNQIKADIFQIKGLFCFGFIFIISILASIILYKFWLKYSASSNPKLQGMFSVISLASLSASVYALHCDNDSIFYIDIFYGSAILALSILAKNFANKFLAW